MTSSLFAPVALQSLKLKNRVAMAPMTRSRTSQPGDVPNAMMADYYQQRADAGLIITEGAPISAVARGYSMTPGIYTPEHIEGWKLVTRQVHDAGGKIFIQLWHVGRRSHSSISGHQPLAPSACKDADKVFGPLPEGGFGMLETEMPRAMTEQDIQDTIADFVQASHNAMAAGFDGVEIHAAHGYLFDSFMRNSTNQRTDGYGGSQHNRIRFLRETLEAVVNAIGSDKVAVRVSPHIAEGFASYEPEIVPTVLLLLEQIAPLNLAYMHLSENISTFVEVPEAFRQQMRAVYPHPVMVAGKLTTERAQALLDSGYADLFAFGTPYVSNPDLVTRMQNGWPLADFDADARLTLYGGNEKGYTDYPKYQG
ncbi:alkene reductase [Salmonella enterica subsp. enterica serovar Choleraesuis]|nr:alkene reductase [Salmonella enterica subsp. enterica serovar Choleraesuis]